MALIVIDVSGGASVVPEDRLRDLRRAVDRIVEPPLTGVVTGAAPLADAVTRESLDSAGKAEKLAIAILLLVLLLVFRSPLAATIPLLVAGATVAAGRGVLVLAVDLLDLNAIAAVLLSMIGLALGVDYSLLIVTRFREALADGDDPRHAAVLGVFAAFATTDVANVQQFGVGLGTAILIDATIVRLVLLPAVMRLAGPHTWAFPDRLERAVPELDVEGIAYVRTREEMATRAAEVW